MNKPLPIVLMSLSLIIVAVIAYSLYLTSRIYVPEVLPNYAASYSILNASCVSSSGCHAIKFLADSSERSLHEFPPYKIRNFPREAKTEIIFDRTASFQSEFDYGAVMNDSLVDKLDYAEVNGSYVFKIYRKGAFVPVKNDREGPSLTIVLPENATEQPISFSAQEPVDKSTVYPSRQNIGIETSLKNPLKEVLMYMNDKLVVPVVTDLGSYRYSLNYRTVLNNDEQYRIRVIIVDDQDNAAASAWEFEAVKPAKVVRINGDRFKYLGWWAEINRSNAAIFEEPSTQSKKLATFSTINRVKVLDEVAGESINRNNVWYKIDGGAFPGSYIFSANVDAIAQPEPPAFVKVPEDVKEGEYWIDVDLTKKILTLFLYDKPVFVTYAALGRSTNPTLPGKYRIWYKLDKTRMKGGPPIVAYKYDLPNVPWVMYYRGSYAIHGTYWHDKFGTRQSAGCTNLTQGDAKYIYDLVNPRMEAGAKTTRSTTDNPGTVVINHY